MYWSDNGELVAVCSDDSFYVLKYDQEVAQRSLATNEGIDEDGVELAFDVSERVWEGRANGCA